jgi:hypothetical protein
MEIYTHYNVSARHKTLAGPPPPQESADAPIFVAQIFLAEHNLFVRTYPPQNFGGLNSHPFLLLQESTGAHLRR